MYWRFFLIVYENNMVNLKWSYLTASRRRRIEPTVREFSVEMVRETDDGFETLLRQYVKLRRYIDDQGKYVKTERLGTILADIPFPPETTHIRILRGDIQLLRISVLDKPPLVKLASKKVTPKGVQEISWSAKTKEGHALWFSVFIELDGIKYPLASKIRESQVKIRFDELPGCKRGRIVVRASSGFYTAEDATQYFSLPFKPPQTLITYPREGDELRFGQPLQLRGQGFDVQARKHLPANALEWSIDGVPVGKGRLCVVPRLELGRHVVTLRATDESGRVGESKINFTASRKSRSPAAKRSTSSNSKKSKST